MAVLHELAKRLSLLPDDVALAATGTVVFAYQRVGGGTSSPLDLSLDQFRRQMVYLADAESVVSLDEALEKLACGETLADPPCVLTFDNCGSDFVDVILPVLAELGLPATLYVATSHIDAEGPTPPERRLSWNAIRESVSTGLVMVGANTHTRAVLDRCDPMTVDLELDVCNDRIATEVGVKPEHFAYPKAIAGSRYADGAVRLRYRSAAVAGTRPNLPGATDCWKLKRTPVRTADSWEEFVRKSTGSEARPLVDESRRRLDTSRRRSSAS